MPITQYVKRRYLSDITTRVNDRVQHIILHGNHGDKRTIQNLSAAPSTIHRIKVVPFSYEYHQIKLLVDVKAKTIVETVIDNESFRKEIVSNHQLEYILDFRGEERLDFINIGPIKPIDFDKEKQLANDLLPYLYKEQYESTAERFLEEFYPNSLKTPMPIFPEVALEKMGMKVVEDNLSHDSSILGKTHFKSGNTLVYDRACQEYKEIFVSENTVLYESPRTAKGNSNLTLAHEAYHIFDHKPHIIIKEYLSKETDYKTFERDFSCSTKWLEQQAQVIPPRILMPKNPFLIKALEYIQELTISHTSIGFLEILRKTIEKLSDFFSVSKQSVRIRLIELGYPEARGVFEYVDGRYLSDYAFNTERLKPYETLTISKKQLGQLYISNESFREKIDSGRYKYINSHVVLNRSDLIMRALGMEFLTDKALQNLDSYALVFSIKKSDGNFTKGSDDFVLYRLYSSSFSLERSFKDGAQYSDSARQDTLLLEQLERESKLLKSLPNDFAACMKLVREWQKCTYDEIAEAIDCDKKKVERLFRDETGNLQLFILIMVYLQLPADVIKHILSLSRYRLNECSKEQLLYKLIINSFQGQSVEYTKDFLLEHEIILTY